MSHLIKSHSNLKKVINYTAYFFLLISIVITTLNYEGNKLLIFIYAILINIILLNGFKKNSYFFEFFFGILLWLGFWLKIIFIVNYYYYAFFEGAGDIFEKIDLEKRLILLDEAFLISIIAFSSYLLAVICKDFFFRNFQLSPLEDLKSSKKAIVNKFQNFVIIILFILIIFTAFFNLDNLIYQRGLKSQSEFNFIFNGTIKWLLLFGFSSIICLFLFFNLSNKIKIYQLAFFSIFETFISNISYLSRGMIFNALSIFYGLYKSNKIYKLKLKPKFFIIYFLTIFIFFFVSVSSINYLRHNFYFYNFIEKKDDNKEKIDIFDKETQDKKIVVEKRYHTLESALHEFYFLAINRWVGIDAVLSTSANKEKNWNTFVNSFTEEYNPKRLPYYERVIQQREIGLNESQINYGITTPGIISFLFYSGSKIFLSISFFLLIISMLFFEKYILRSTTNLIFCALIIQQVAYRLIHFGYMPLNSYMFFGTIFFTIVLHQLVLRILKNIDL